MTLPPSHKKRAQIRSLYWAANLVLLGSLFFCSRDPLGQTRPGRRPPPAPSQSRGQIDYSLFSHATKKHQAACDTCHKIPSSSWRKTSSFPDITDYPGHEACVSCHRSQFFKGARPTICSGCHTKVSPRDEARFPFRKPGAPRQFTIEFPHDKHQDVIAMRVGQGSSGQPIAQARILTPFFAHRVDDKSKVYNNCAVCHTLRSAALSVPTAGWPDNFVPTTAAFKSSPVDHGACFSCHWKSQQPVNSNCGGCHKLADTPKPLEPGPKRISMKFRHDREQHVAECTTCHINITKAASLRGLKPDVPITSCSECHNKEGLRLDVGKELEALDKNRDYVCTYCHTANVGHMDPPPGHYLIAGREPLKRRDIK